MYNEDQAKKLVERAHPGTRAVDCFPYNDLYLVRVQHPDPDEADYDPFYSVGIKTGIVSEFSVLTEDRVAIAKAYQKYKGSG